VPVLPRAMRTPITGAAILAGQVLHAAHRPDMPGLPDQDPSGVFGDPGAPHLRIVMLGDSSITGPGVEPLDAMWTRVLAQRLSDRYCVELVSFAAGGSKARDVIVGQLPAALATRADLAIVSVGANDALRATPLVRYEAELRHIVRRLTDHVFGVGVSGIGDLGNLPRLPTLAKGIGKIRGRSFDRAVARVAAEFPNVVKNETWGPQWQLFADGDPDVVFAADLFHADAPGQQLFADAFMPVIETILALVPPDAGRHSSAG
jgi:lysophospholipase L1-like esterase